MSGQIEDPRCSLQEHTILPEASGGRSGPGVEMWPVSRRSHHPPGPGHHQQDRELGLEEDQHLGPLRRQGQGGG